MFDTETCYQCGQSIDINRHAARVKNPAVGEIGYVYFHQRGRGDCYWQYLRDTVIKAQQSERTESAITGESEC